MTFSEVATEALNWLSNLAKESPSLALGLLLVVLGYLGKGKLSVILYLLGGYFILRFFGLDTLLIDFIRNELGGVGS